MGCILSLWKAISFHFPSLKIFEVNNNLKLLVLQEDFDTSTCRREYDFKGIQKKMKINEIYYTGDINISQCK